MVPLSEKSRERRNSAGDMLGESPKMSKKKFAQSTTALHLLNEEQKSSGFSLRGKYWGPKILFATRWPYYQ